jgi:DNA-binding GntR family transcriptional regulator
LRNAIITRELPPHTRLVEADLAQKLGVSRWPVRQAVARLVQERLVTSYPHRGDYVVGLSPEDVEDIYALRTVLEVHAGRKAACHLSQQDLQQFRTLLSEMVEAAKFGDYARYSLLDTEFHHRIVLLAKSERLVEMWQLLRPSAQVLTVMGVERDSSSMQGVYERHAPLIDALASCDADVIEAAIRRHLTEAEARAKGTLVDAGDVPMSAP